MSRYQIMLTPELDIAYQSVANELNMSVEQVLSSAVQIYMERLTLENYESFANVERVRNYKDKRRKIMHANDV